MPAMHDASSPAVPTISIVLPSCGRLDLLDRCLDALTLQTLDQHSTEIIVVDDEPDHHTLHLVTGWRNRTLGRGLTLRLCARRLSGTAHSVAHVTEMALTSLLLPPLQVFWRLAGALRFRVRFA